MKRGTIIFVAFIVLAIFFGMYGCSKRNTFTTLREAAKAQWQQVESQYQRRMDLIPNMVETVKGEANFEKSTLEAVTNARANATSIKMNVENLDEATMQKYRAAQGEISMALGRLLAVSENYPQLQSNRAFSDLRITLEGTENRIATERMKYNETTREYNRSLQIMPGSIFNWNFEAMPYFEAEAGAEKAPKVKFE